MPLKKTGGRATRIASHGLTLERTSSTDSECSPTFSGWTSEPQFQAELHHPRAPDRVGDGSKVELVLKIIVGSSVDHKAEQLELTIHFQHRPADSDLFLGTIGVPHYQPCFVVDAISLVAVGALKSK